MERRFVHIEYEHSINFIQGNITLWFMFSPGFMGKSWCGNLDRDCGDQASYDLPANWEPVLIDV